MRISLSLPVFGPLFFRHSVRATAHAAQRGDREAVRKLASIAATTPDARSRTIARALLGTLHSQETINVFCEEVMARNDPDLETLAVSRGYAPADPEQRALFEYITNQYAAYCRSDPEPHHPLLARGYATAHRRVQERALLRGLGSGMSPALARALAGTDPEKNAAKWSFEEWDIVLEGLADEGAWEEIWQLIPSAPPASAVRVMKRMRRYGHMPEGDMRKVAEEVYRDLPESWTSPVSEKPLISITNQDSRSVRLAFSRDSSLLASGTCDGAVSIWQVSSARLLASLHIAAGSTIFLAFTPDKTCVIVGGDKGLLSCREIISGKVIWSQGDETLRITYVCSSGSGEEVRAGDHRGNVFRIACVTGKILQTMHSRHPSPVTALTWDPAGSAIAVGHEDGTVCLRDSDSGAELWIVKGTGDPVRAISFAADRKNLLVIHEYAVPVLRDSRSGEILGTCAGSPGHLSCYTISGDGQTAAIGCNDHVLRILDGAGNPAAEIPFYNRLPTCCTMTPDRTLLACGCNEGTIFYFTIPDGRYIREFRRYLQPVTVCAISPDGSLLATAGGEGTVTLSAIPSGEIQRTLRRPAGAVMALAVAGGAILTGTSDGVMRFYAPKDGGLIRSIDLYTPSVRALAADREGKYVACGGGDASLRIWDLRRGNLVSSCEGMKKITRCVTFLPSRDICISGGWDGIVRFWSVPDGKPVRSLKGHTSIITCCCTDSEGETLITGSNDTTVRIWDLTGTKEPLIIRDAGKEITCCTVSLDNRILAAAGPEPVIRLYNLPEGSVRSTIPQVPGKPTSLAFINNGLALAAGYESGTLAFYSLQDHALIRTVSAHAGAISGIGILPEGDSIATSGADGLVRIFRTPIMSPLVHATLDMLTEARAEELAAGTEDVAGQWRFLCHLLSLRFQNEIGLCPVFCDAGAYDIQIVG